MKKMFQHAKNFNQSLDSWDVRNVANIRCMFQNAASFNQNLDAWNLSTLGDKINSVSEFVNALNSGRVDDFFDDLDGAVTVKFKDLKKMFNVFEFSAQKPLPKWYTAINTLQDLIDLS